MGTHQEASPRLVIIAPSELKDTVCELTKGELVIGHSNTADLVLDDQYVSRRHALVTVDSSGTATIRDLKSAGGTFVNDRPVEQSVTLRPGDLVRFAQVVTRFEPAPPTTDAVRDRDSPTAIRPSEEHLTAPAASTRTPTGSSKRTEMESIFATSNDDFPGTVGGLYARWTLDCLIELGYAVSNDAITRPQLYQSNTIPDDLVTLQMSYGTAPFIPNAAQRQAMLMPILGPSDGRATGSTSTSQSAFLVARQNFLDACAAFAHVAADIDRPILDERVRSAASTLRAHFEGVRGKSFALSEQQIRSVFDLAVRILTSPGITTVFGIDHVDGDRPLGPSGPNGAKLVEAIGRGLPVAQDCRMTFTDFLLLERIAREGARAIHALLSPQSLSDHDLTPITGAGYTWGASLRELSTGSQAVGPRTAAGPNNPPRVF